MSWPLMLLCGIVIIAGYCLRISFEEFRDDNDRGMW